MPRNVIFCDIQIKKINKLKFDLNIVYNGPLPVVCMATVIMIPFTVTVTF